MNDRELLQLLQTCATNRSLSLELQRAATAYLQARTREALSNVAVAHARSREADESARALEMRNHQEKWDRIARDEGYRDWVDYKRRYLDRMP